MSVLCDTNIFSELVKRTPNSGVLKWSQQIVYISLSVITVEEIYYGLAWKPNDRIRQWFDAFVNEHCDVLPISSEIAKAAGVLRGALRARGEDRTQADMLIAATASVHGLTLVTRNERDFRSCNISVLNPFT